jgi:hypothetical protein
MTPQDKATKIKRLEDLGSLVPGCPGCAVFYEADDPTSVWAPRHKPGATCGSGGHPHCTCDGCF